MKKRLKTYFPLILEMEILHHHHTPNETKVTAAIKRYEKRDTAYLEKICCSIIGVA